MEDIFQLSLLLALASLPAQVVTKNSLSIHFSPSYEIPELESETHRKVNSSNNSAEIRNKLSLIARGFEYRKKSL